jgi:hypothetical protein
MISKMTSILFYTQGPFLFTIGIQIHRNFWIKSCWSVPSINKCKLKSLKEFSRIFMNFLWNPRSILKYLKKILFQNSEKLEIKYRPLSPDVVYVVELLFDGGNVWLRWLSNRVLKGLIVVLKYLFFYKLISRFSGANNLNINDETNQPV